MASELLKTFQKIERGRLACIDKARELGITNITENSSLEDIRQCLDLLGYKSDWTDSYISLIDTSMGTNITRLPESITELGNYAFYRRTNFNPNILPDTIETIGDYALYYVQTPITKLPRNLKTLKSYALAYTNLADITELPDTIEKIGSNAFNEANLTKLTKLPRDIKVLHNYAFPPETLNNLEALPDNVTIGYGIFKNSDLTKLTSFGNNIQVGIQDTEPSSSGTYGFNGVSFDSLEEFPNTLNKLKWSCFYNCSFPILKKMFNKITTTATTNSTGGAYAVFTSCNFAELEEFPEDFEGCIQNFTTCTFEKLKKLPKKLNSYAFASCIFKNIIGELDLSDHTMDPYCLSGCSFNKVTSLITPANSQRIFENASFAALTSLHITSKSIGQYAFNGCDFSQLTSLTSEATSVGNYAFGGTKIPNIEELPNSIESTGYESFRSADLTGLKKLPDNLKSCGEYCFTSAKFSFTTLILPKNFTYMITRCFQYCSTIETIIVTASSFGFHSYGLQNMTALSKLVFPNIEAVPTLSTATSTLLNGSTKLSASAGYIYVPSHLVDKMKTHSYWKTLASRIKPLEDWSGYQDWLASNSTGE